MFQEQFFKGLLPGLGSCVPAVMDAVTLARGGKFLDGGSERKTSARFRV